MVTALGVDVETIPAWLYFVGPMITLMMGGLATTVISHYRSVQRGKLVPRSTLDLMVAQYEDRIKETDKDRDEQVAAARAELNIRMENFRADHALRTDQAREDHDKQLAALVRVTEGVRADFAVVLAKADRDIDQWRGAWQISDQASREEIAGQLEELVAFARTFARWMTEFQRQTGVPELPRNGANTG